MAVRTPLKMIANGELQELSTAEIDSIIDACIFHYAGNPTVGIGVANTGGTMGSIDDTRFISGTSSVTTGNQNTVDDGAAEYADENTTAEPTKMTVTYSRMTQGINTGVAEPTDTNNIRFPLCYDNGNLVAMSITDLYDTFVDPAIVKLVDGSNRPGTFRIHTATTLTGHTLVSTTPVFVDTKADLAGITSGEIGTTGTTQEDAEVVTNYYMFVVDQGTLATYPSLVYARTDAMIQELASTDLNAALEALIQHRAANGASGSRIRYNLGGAGVNKGSGMVDTAITATAGAYNTRFVSADDYRAQEFPTGVATVQTTTFLKITNT
jgi:hypothetical protein